MAHFISGLDLPQRLRDVRVPENEIHELAGLVHDILNSAPVSERRVRREHVVAVLAGAY
jgi:hypothetical protein